MSTIAKQGSAPPKAFMYFTEIKVFTKGSQYVSLACKIVINMGTVVAAASLSTVLASGAPAGE
jgi:hypothetical protein